MPSWYGDLLDSVAERFSAGSRRAVSAVNAELLTTYWHVGQDILDRQRRKGWGAAVIDRLSADLRERFPSAKGFSPRNLRYIRAFADAWDEPAILQAPLAELPWFHHTVLLDKLNAPDVRLWYATAALREGWSGRFLALQIDAALHSRRGKAVSNFSATMPAEASSGLQELTKDPYLFDFLDATDTRNERVVERALVDHVGEFLLELGQGFAFVGKQVRLIVGGEEFFCDLLFYHLRLRRFVVIELKAVPFQPGFLGQLGLYMAAVDDLLAAPEDGRTIGLLLCRSKNNVIAEYALRTMSAPIGVANWTEAITTSLPEDLTATLPSIEELEAELSTEPSANEPPSAS